MFKESLRLIYTTRFADSDSDIYSADGTPF